MADVPAALRALADRVEQLAPAQVVGARAAHEHEPGILRDTVRCRACAATMRDRTQEGAACATRPAAQVRVPEGGTSPRS